MAEHIIDMAAALVIWTLLFRYGLKLGHWLDVREYCRAKKNYEAIFPKGPDQ